MTRSTARRLLWPTVLALALPAALARPARADDADLLASLYTDTGYELRRDDRLFALLCAFNVDGFDRAQQARALPFPRRLFHPLRQTVREALLPRAKQLRPALDAFFDAHPLPVEAYERAAFLLGKPPAYAAGADFPKELAGLDQLLAKFAKDADLEHLARATATEYRAEFKNLREVVDPPFARLRAAYRLSEDTAPLLVLVPEPLDSPDAVLALRTKDGSHLVMFGLPAEGPVSLRPALDAYARLLASEATASATVKGLDELVAKLKTEGVLPAAATSRTVVADSLRAAVDARLNPPADPAAAIENATRAGLVLADSFYAALGAAPDAYPADKGPFVQQVLSTVDLAKAAAAAHGGESGRKTTKRK